MRFVHPPRTGGSSVVRSWGLTKPEYRGHKPPAKGDGWRYGFTRNPWDRVVSLYHLAHRGKPNVAFADWVLGGMVADGSNGRRFESHVTLPTLHWLRDADWVGRFETRAVDLAELARRLRRKFPAKHENRSQHRGAAPYWEYYRDREDVVEYVRERYAQDVHVYGYEYRPPKVFVYSVPGSGTRFVYSELLREGAYADLKAAHPDVGRDPRELVDDMLAAGYSVVVPVRDPMHTLISNTNAMWPEPPKIGVGDFRSVLMWKDDPRVLYVPVDAAPTMRESVVRAVAEHTGASISHVPEWKPQRNWVTPDRTGLRQAYDEGRRDPRLADLRDVLLSDPGVASFYQAWGYSL